MSLTRLANEIVAIRLDGVPGELGALAAGGDGSSHDGFLSRSERGALGEEMAAILAWGPAVVLALTAEAEIEARGILGLPAFVRAEKPAWFLLPIAELSERARTFESRWLHASHVAHGALRSGERVLVYGPAAARRVGAVSARLLAELRRDAEAAIAAVEAARPERPLTTDAIQWIRFALDRAPDYHVADWLLGCLLGGAVGDAFGAPYEFIRRRELARRFGPHGPLQPMARADGHGAPALLVSDDTQLTLFAAEGIGEAFRTSVPSIDRLTLTIGRAYRDWLTTQAIEARDTGERVPDYVDWIVSAEDASRHAPQGALRLHPALRFRRSPDEASLTALTGRELGHPGSWLNDAASAVSVVRAAPLGLIRGWPPELVFEAACRSAALTHGHPLAILSAGVLAATVRGLCKGERLLDALDHALSLVARSRGSRWVESLVRRACILAMPPRLDHDAVFDELGDGRDGDSALAIGIYAALAGHDFASALRVAANHDGNSASTAAITGQLLGAAAGVHVVPRVWAQSLDVYVPLLGEAARLVALGRNAGR